MSINFAGVQSVTIPEGVVTKITDAAGRVLWQAGGNTVVLEVEKITSNTYAGETTYENESFILLDIYPKTNGTVTVAYGGLTKTITDTSGAAEPNAQQVFFGTFNGVSDTTTTPESGELTIKGDYAGFGCGSFTQMKSVSYFCPCIIEMKKIGLPTMFPECAMGNPNQYSNSNMGSKLKQTIVRLPFGVKRINVCAFSGCSKTENIVLNNDLVEIDNFAFSSCTSLTGVHIPASVNTIADNPWLISSYNADFSISVDSGNASYEAVNNCLVEISSGRLVVAGGNFTIPANVTSIGNNAFEYNESLTTLTLPENLTTIGNRAFLSCKNLSQVTIPAGVTSIGEYAFSAIDTITVILLSTIPPEIGTTAFGAASGHDGLNIIVPKGCREAYKSANMWSSYSSFITEVS